VYGGARRIAEPRTMMRAAGARMLRVRNVATLLAKSATTRKPIFYGAFSHIVARVEPRERSSAHAGAR
jgi:hypothetical protein